MTRVAVLMIRDRGSNFRGEKCLFEEDLANRLVSEKTCLLLDENGEPIMPTEGVVNDGAGNSGEGNSGGAGGGNEDGNKPKGKGKPKPKGKTDANPFEIDGFDAKIIAALAEAGINNPDELRAYVASGKTLAALPVIGVTTEKELLDLYGAE